MSDPTHFVSLIVTLCGLPSDELNLNFYNDCKEYYVYTLGEDEITYEQCQSTAIGTLAHWRGTTPNGHIEKWQCVLEDLR